MPVNRRYFFMGAMGAAAVAQKAFSQSTIGTGMIGVGNRGSYVLQGVLQQAGVKVNALCDIKADRLDKAATAAAAHNPATMKDYRDLLKRSDIDAVFIETPCDLHVEMTKAALAAGKHVYCEKPAGVNAASIQDLVQAVKASNKVFQIGQQMRSMARLRKTVERVHEGVAGDIIMIKAQRNAADDLAHDGQSADWFFDAKRSGDVIVEMSVHNLDLVNWLTRSRPERAAGVGGTLLYKNDPPGRTNMDGYSVVYDHANGVKVSYTQTFFHPRGMPGGGSATLVYGTKGGVDVDTSTFYPHGRSGKPTVLVEKEEEDRHAHVTAFFDSIRSGKKPPADVMVAATAALAAILGRDSIYRKQTLTWDGMGIKI
jgi:myo-inositol 2-dehydrogenase/D-chiro-inositol 1-dehydrogenase